MTFVPLLILLLIPCIALCVIGYRRPEFFAAQAFPHMKMWLLLSIIAYGFSLSMALFPPRLAGFFMIVCFLVHAAAYVFYAFAMGCLFEVLASQNIKKSDGRKPELPTRQ